MPKEFFNIAVVYTEEDRQAVLLALAHLAVERPGWDYMLSQLAAKMDNEVAGRPELFDKFKELALPERKLIWEKFHALWGTSRDGKYDKQLWCELQALLQQVFREPG